VDIKNQVPSIDSTISNNIDEDLVADGFFFHDAPLAKEQPQLPTRYSPPSKRSGVDKWAALGERRRAHTGNSATLKAAGAALKTVRPVGNGLHFGSLAHGVSDLTGYSHHNYTVNHGGNHGSSSLGTPTSKWHTTPGRDRSAKDGLATKGRDRDWNWNFNWRKEKRHDFGDVEWVGGWQDAHS